MLSFVAESGSTLKIEFRSKKMNRQERQEKNGFEFSDFMER